MVDLKELARDSADGSAADGRDVWRYAVRPADKDRGTASEPDSESLRPPDLMVLYVDIDDTDTRYNEWRKVILESKTVTYADVPVQDHSQR